MGILSGVRVVEFEGLGPGPFCGMMLADHGADVILIERKGGMGGTKAEIFKRGKRSIVLDLKDDSDREVAMAICAGCDALIEGLRPGVMERLGLGPGDVQKANPKLVYGRLTGWGQDGPLAKTAGHDLNYVSLSGANWYSGKKGEAPIAPPTLVGDVAGGALYLAFGILAGVMRARETGKGTIVDAAIVDGSAHMMNLLYSLRAAGGLPDERGQSMLDGAHFYSCYQCKDDLWISIGPLEPKFYHQLISLIASEGDDDMQNQFATEKWPDFSARFAKIFRSQPRAFWDEKLRGTDVCYAPVLSPSQAADDEHMKARNIYHDVDGVLQTAAAPRFDGAMPAPPAPPPRSGDHAVEILKEFGIRR